VVKTIFNELYQALNMKKIMKKNPLRKYKFPCPFFISPINLLNELAPVTMEFLRKHTDNGVMEPLKLMNR
jgi:hypothetical protein